MSPTEFKQAQADMMMTNQQMADLLGCSLRQVCSYRSGETKIPHRAKMIIDVRSSGPRVTRDPSANKLVLEFVQSALEPVATPQTDHWIGALWGYFDLLEREGK